MKILRKPSEWQQGAIGMKPEHLANGLLFVLPNEHRWPITMHGMDIPLEVYWLTQSGFVMEHMDLFPGMPDYTPEAISRYVLEFSLGEEPRYKVGDFVELPL